MKKEICARLCCLFVLLAFFCACGANAPYSQRVMRQPHDRFYIEMRQPGKQNVRALAETLKLEALRQCEISWFHNAWIRVLHAGYNPATNETVGTVTIQCVDRTSHLW